jgi:hypothetical protein
VDLHHRLTIESLALLVLAGCGHRAGEPADERVFTPPPHAETVVAERQEAVRVLGDDGQLLPSTQFSGGVRLPRGLEPVQGESDARAHVFVTHLPPDKLARYFGPMLVTGAVTRVGAGVVYHGATIRGSTSQARVDVSILPSGVQQTRVQIDELSVVTTAEPLTEQRAQQLLRQPID